MPARGDSQGFTQALPAETIALAMRSLPGRQRCLILVLAAVGAAVPQAIAQDQQATTTRQAQTQAVAAEQEFRRRQEERRRFQDQEPTTARPLTFVFSPGAPPSIVWRDTDEVRRPEADGKRRVR